MSTWEELASYLRAAYRPAEDTGELLKIFCRHRGGTQLMIVERASHPHDALQAWATILSPVATAYSVDAENLLKLAARVHVVGGLVRVDDTLYLRHSVPLASLSLHDFVAPFQSILIAAAELQRHCTPDY